VFISGPSTGIVLKYFRTLAFFSGKKDFRGENEFTGFAEKESRSN
jgi:hypothetical protein